MCSIYVQAVEIISVIVVAHIKFHAPYLVPQVRHEGSSWCVVVSNRERKVIFDWESVTEMSRVVYCILSTCIRLSDRNRIESFEMWYWRKMLGISWQEHRTNISILEEIGLGKDLMGKVARIKLQYFGHVTRGSAGNLALTILEGSVDSLRHQGRPSLPLLSTQNLTTVTLSVTIFLSLK